MKVLDHGHVELVDHMGSDLTVANAARLVDFIEEINSMAGGPTVPGMLENAGIRQLEVITF